MANLRKNSRKVFATSVSAAMVASAVAPAAVSADHEFSDVPSDHSYHGAIDALVDAGVVTGFEDGEFKMGEQVTRSQAAMFLANILGLEADSDTELPFEDVKEDVWYTDAVKAVYEAEVMVGTSDDNFDPDRNMTRAELVQAIYAAYNVTDHPNADLPFDDIDEDKWYMDALKATYAEGLVNGMTSDEFGPTEDMKRGDFAWLLTNTDYRFGDTLEKPEVDATSAMASSKNTITLEGEALYLLDAEDITVEGQTVKGVSYDGRAGTLSVMLEGELTPDSTTDVTVTYGEDDNETFEVAYGMVVSDVAIADQTFDDDRAGQVVEFGINGSSTGADVNYLQLAGYDVTFVAKNASGAAANGFFANNSDNTSSTGVLAANIPMGNYSVEVQVTKAGEALVTDTADVTITNFETEVEGITQVNFLNNDEMDADGSSEAFLMNSKTLVSGETVTVDSVYATIAGNPGALNSGEYTLKSSDPAVLSINGSGDIVAESAGEATITLSAGTVEKTFTFNVTNSKRYLADISTSSKYETVIGYPYDVYVVGLDQYGDPMEIDAADIDEVDQANILADDELTTVNTTTGLASFTLNGQNKGTGNVYFKDAAGNILGSFGVYVSDINNTGSYNWEINGGTSTDVYSDDTSLHFQSDSKLKYELNRYNTEGIYLNNVAVNSTDYSVEVVDSSVASATITGGAVEITAKNVNDSTDVLIKDAQGATVKVINVDVNSTAQRITDVDFKGTSTVDYQGATVNYADVLDVTASDADDIVNGVTLAQNTNYLLRISEDTNAGLLYLDVDGNADYDSTTDIGLATLTLSTTSNSNFSVSGSDAINGHTTGSNDDGTLLFKVMTDTSDATTAIAGTSVTIDVK